jgi:hypothetical protein
LYDPSQEAARPLRGSPKNHGLSTRELRIVRNLIEKHADEIRADRLAAKLAAEAGAQEHLEAFLIGAVEAWLRRQGIAGGESASWGGAFEKSAVDFVDENHELFEELARR